MGLAASEASGAGINYTNTEIKPCKFSRYCLVVRPLKPYQRDIQIDPWIKKRSYSSTRTPCRRIKDGSDMRLGILAFLSIFMNIFLANAAEIQSLQDAFDQTSYVSDQLNRDTPYDEDDYFFQENQAPLCNASKCSAWCWNDSGYGTHPCDGTCKYDSNNQRCRCYGADNIATDRKICTN